MLLASSGFEWLVLHSAGGPFKSTAAGTHDNQRLTRWSQSGGCALIKTRAVICKSTRSSVARWLFLLDFMKKKSHLWPFIRQQASLFINVLWSKTHRERAAVAGVVKKTNKNTKQNSCRLAVRVQILSLKKRKDATLQLHQPVCETASVGSELRGGGRV